MKLAILFMVLIGTLFAQSAASYSESELTQAMTECATGCCAQLGGSWNGATGVCSPYSTDGTSAWANCLEPCLTAKLQTPNSYTPGTPTIPGGSSQGTCCAPVIILLLVAGVAIVKAGSG